MSEKAINDLHLNNIRVVDKEFLRESKSGNKIYKVTFERKHAYGEEPTYKYVRKNDIRFKRVDGEAVDGGQQEEKPKFEGDIIKYANELKAWNDRIKEIEAAKKKLNSEKAEKTIDTQDYKKENKLLNDEKFDLETKIKRIKAGTSVPSDFEEEPLTPKGKQEKNPKTLS